MRQKGYTNPCDKIAQRVLGRSLPSETYRQCAIYEALIEDHRELQNELTQTYYSKFPKTPSNGDAHLN
jgi:hypothetical protein